MFHLSNVVRYPPTHEHMLVENQEHGIWIIWTIVCESKCIPLLVPDIGHVLPSSRVQE